MNMQKNVLVTGATGFIGSHICERLSRDNCNVFAVGVKGENKPFQTTKLGKNFAKYTSHSMSGEQCKNCMHFEPPNRCGIVQGHISKDGWCKYFEEE